MLAAEYTCFILITIAIDLGGGKTSAIFFHISAGRHVSFEELDFLC